MVMSLPETVAEEALEEVLPHLRSVCTKQDEVGQTLTRVTDALRGGINNIPWHSLGIHWCK